MREADAVWLIVAGLAAAVALLDPAQVREVLTFALAALGHTAPYIAIAVALIAYLKASEAEGIVAKAFQGQETRMIVLAALVGGLAPFCSCEVIPFVAALLAAGTPLSAVMAFWLSSPLMDPPTFMITTGALGIEFAIGKVVSAVAIGLAGGFAMRAMMRTGWFENPLRDRLGCGSCCGSSFGGKPVWRFWEQAPRRSVFAATALQQVLFLLKWMSLAYMLEAILVFYVPAEAIASFVGGEGAWPVVLGALLGAPAYLNGYAAPALVAGLMEQGMTAGAAMAFMTAGAVSSVPAMAAVWALVKKEVFALYVLFGVGGAIVIGLGFGALMGM
ncbi:MAG: permease [Pseudomonadota bacterium]